jgi:hypothetical protein
MRLVRLGLLAVVLCSGLSLGCNNKPAPVTGGGGGSSVSGTGAGDNTTAGAAAETPGN